MQKQSFLLPRDSTWSPSEKGPFRTTCERVIKVYHSRCVSKISRRNLQVWATEPKLLKMAFASTAEYTRTTDNKGSQSFATFFLKIVAGGGGGGGEG